MRLEIFYGEDLAEALMTKDPFPEGHWYHMPRETFALAGGEHPLRNHGRRAFRYLNIVSHGPAAFHLRGVRAVLEHAPVSESGWFACSDTVLNKAWEISRRTTRLCMQSFYEDGIKRDGMLWIGDYRVEFLCGSYLFGDVTLTRRSQEMMAQCQHADGSLPAAALRAGGHQYPRIDYLTGVTNPGGLERWVLANYCTDFVGAMEEYVLRTDDLALLRELAVTVRGVLS